MERGKTERKQKPLIERRLAEAVQDVREGRIHGPFKSAEAMRQSLRQSIKAK